MAGGDPGPDATEAGTTLSEPGHFGPEPCELFSSRRVGRDLASMSAEVSVSKARRQAFCSQSGVLAVVADLVLRSFVNNQRRTAVTPQIAYINPKSQAPYMKP